jgi:phosphoribosylanthranilate isomerase
MKIKVCGMRDAQNVADVASLSPDFMGFIFYPPSPRSVSGIFKKELLESLTAKTSPVAVFVNSPIDYALSILKEYNFKYAQLHGGESVAYCDEIKKAGFGVIKVFSIDEHTSFEEMAEFATVADYFLFDTKSPKHGGTGQKFAWSLLDKYTLDKPVILSGGIGLEDANELKEIDKKYSWVVGFDLNSKFEIEAGVKDVEKLRQFFLAMGV